MNNFKPDSLKNILEKIEKAKQDAVPMAEVELSRGQVEKAVSKFIKGEYDIEKLKKIFGELPELGGMAVFNTLSGFIQAVRHLGLEVDVQNEILEHENAHMLEVEQRGYRFQYSIQFTRDKGNFFTLFITKKMIKPSLSTSNLFSKHGSEPTEEELRSDLFAIISAPKNLTKSKLSKGDINLLTRTS